MSDTLAFIRKRYTELPVATVIEQLQESLAAAHAVLSAPTGSGKTTLAPLALLDSPTFLGKRILMLEPRRIAARAAAVRMSEMLGETVGNTVGYRTRVESRISASTRLEVVTEGILIRRLQHDPELTGVGLVIFDEFHERSLQADLGLALCLDLTELRDDLRLLVMSATLNAAPICKLLGSAPHITASGRSYPVTIEHLPPRNQNSPLASQVTYGVLHAYQNLTGDILAFLPGTGDIHRCRQLLNEKLPEAHILPLYGNLSHQEQDRIFRRDDDRRRIILATPIAETSLTIENITAVVDSGYYRRPVYDHGSSLNRLTTFRISKSSADQRAGRAGRLGPGHCFRLWSKEVEHSLLAQTPPEIIGADLSSLVLELALWGVTDSGQLRWLDPPRSSAWETAVQLLQSLALLDRTGHITTLGRRVATLPMHPRLGVMLVKGVTLGLSWTASLTAAILAERDIIKGRDSSADLEERVRLLARFAQKPTDIPPHLDKGHCRRLVEDAKGWLAQLASPKESRLALNEIGNLLAFGYPDRIARLRPGSTNRYQLAIGTGAVILPTDPLCGTELLVAPQLDARQGDGRIFLAAPISEDDLYTHHTHLIREVESISWDSREKRVNAEEETQLGAIVLKRKVLTDPNQEQIGRAFLEGVQQSGSEQLPWSREAREIQARICALRHWQPGKWPDLADTTLMEDLSWLAPYCQGMKRVERLRELDLKTILLSLLSWEKQQLLEKLAPSHYLVPSGSRIRLTYTPGELPILAVRLQELFGLVETPTICTGQIPILLHLLSPAGRPMQITSDLHSFWSTTYPEVRKELAGRYPKHYWPEDPFTATATSRTKKQMLSHRR
ncbi:ATP-dependent helicase HrpB [Desulfopila aestuarii]|uniref:ATP-dependent helicase HrpB n=1 Tax=Desulfopila aestuarii DSM 18488 TaxID=1121416 RepID=A0A1M7Y6G9_9BACT|nr:ATP-dependent helicase HrpB [Desulfopila aestuarii]SHO48243.1 ATP-dependent helicase HrpB [Desulfopila aestuarii DSM 18488]